MRKNLSVLSFLLTCLLSQQTVFSLSSTPAEGNLKIFDSVWTSVNEKYFDVKFNGVDWVQVRETFRPQALAAANEQDLYRIINLMLNELHDPHTYAASPEAIRNARRNVSLDLGFVGRIVEDRVVFTRIVAGSSAQAAGIQPGWILTHVNGVAVDASHFTGLAVGNDETVKLRFVDAQEQVHEARLLARPFIRVPEQTARMLDGQTLYIQFESFDVSHIDEWFAQKIAAHRDARACIIDLRGNVGGTFSVLQAIAAELYPQAAVFGTFIERSGKERPFRVPGRGRKAFTGKIAMLIDNASFSAAELFAAAIQDSGRGKIVGRKSNGAALNNIEQRLPDGGRLYVSIRDYRTSRGQRLEGRGVQPDVPVQITLEDLRRNLDRDLERALEILRF
jgi:carboxyl-terminal processing protease